MLTRCVDHVYSSRLQEEPIVVVVDNGSSDHSTRTLASKYPHVHIIENAKNLGFAAAVNRAMPRCRDAGFLLLVNTDAFLDPDCAQTLLEFLEAHPRVGMVGPRLLNPDGTPQTSFEAFPTLATEILNRSLLKRLFPKRYPGKHTAFASPTPVEGLIGAVVMIRVQALLEVGGFDEDYFFFLEETDLALRMRRKGWQVYHHPGAHAVHLQGATAKKMELESRIEFYRSRYLFFRKHYGRPSTFLLKSAQMANLTLEVGALGLVNAVACGNLPDIARRFTVRYGLWRWHLRGCPDGQGLPRD
jgi:GT2 family glycosyltransferase